MNTVNLSTSTFSSGGNASHTPAYASFSSNMDKLLHVFAFVKRGVQSFHDELKTQVDPQVDQLLAEIAALGGGPEQTRQAEDIARDMSSILLKPLTTFTSGFVTIHQWIPVILVTIVEAYLKDVRVFEARANPAIMESSEQSVTYLEVVRSQSLDDLREEMRSRWARKFVDDGGPSRWIDRLTRMGARGYEVNAVEELEGLWGVRHVIVHSAAVATSGFVGRHPTFGVQVGASIVVRPQHLTKWISAIGHFVDVTDRFFAQRYLPGAESTVAE